MSLLPCFIINGAPAAGKTTISRALMARFERSIHLPVDDLREWVVGGMAHPVDWNEETERQFRIAEEAAADVARRYREAGFAVAFDHCRRPENIEWLTDERLGGPPVYRVMLYSSLEKNLKRNHERENKDFDATVLDPIIEYVHPMMGSDEGSHPNWVYLDNEGEGVEEAVDRLLKRIGPDPCQVC